MKKKIKLGDVSIAKWEKGNSLYPDWMKEEKECVKEIEKNKPDDIVLTSGDYILQIDYPLSNPFFKKFVVKDSGMTREELVILVVKSYKKIYKEEDKSVGHKTGNISGMLNRESSEGKYGIWRHNIGDLVLCSAEVNGNRITLGVDS